MTNKRILRFIAVLLLPIMVLGDPAWAIGVGAFLREHFSSDLTHLSVPPRFGRVTDTHFPSHHPGPVDGSTLLTIQDDMPCPEQGRRVRHAQHDFAHPLVVLIQDLHANIGVQKNIAGILEHLHRRYGISRVYTEAAFGECDVSLFRSIRSRRKRKELVERLLSKALISGADIAAMRVGSGALSPLKLEGVDDPLLYIANVQAFRDLASPDPKRGGVKVGLEAAKEWGEMKEFLRAGAASELKRHMVMIDKLLSLKMIDQDWQAYKGQRHLTPRGSPTFKQAIAAAERFYTAAEARDRAMAENLLNHPEFIEGCKPDCPKRVNFAHGKVGRQVYMVRQAHHDDRSAVALVTGGFHTAAIAKILKDHGLGYAVVTPNVERLDHESLYIQSLTEPPHETVEAVKGTNRQISVQTPWLKMAGEQVRDWMLGRAVVARRSAAKRLEGQAERPSFWNDFKEDLRRDWKWIKMAIPLWILGVLTLGAVGPGGGISASNSPTIEHEGALKAVHDQSLQALQKEMDLTQDPSVDLIILEAGPGEALQKEYQEMYGPGTLRGGGRLLRDDVPILVYNNPETAGPAGNGLAVANALFEAKNWYDSYGYNRPHLRDIYGNLRPFESLRIVLVPAGGLGTRLAQSHIAAAKSLVNVPGELRIASGAPPTTDHFISVILDYVIAGAYKFTQGLKARDQGGVVNLNGDGLLICQPRLKDGINLILTPERVSRALGSLGVVGYDSATGKITTFLEKPKTINVIRETPELAAFLDRTKDVVPANTASWISVGENEHPRLLAAMFAITKFIRSRPSGRCYEIDTSNDLFVPLTLEGGRLEEHVNKRSIGPDGEVDPDKQAYYREVYGIVKNHMPPVLATGMETDTTGRHYTTFYRDLGKTADFLNGVVRSDETLFQVLGFTPVVASFQHPQVYSHASAVRLRSYLDQGVEVDHDAFVCQSLLEDGSVMERESSVFAIGKLHLFEGEILNHVPVYHEGSVHWALEFLHKNQDTMLPIIPRREGDAKGTFLGLNRFVFDWLQSKGLVTQQDGEWYFLDFQGNQEHRILLEPGKTSLFDLPLWPLTNDIATYQIDNLHVTLPVADMALVKWMREFTDFEPRAWREAMGLSDPMVQYRNAVKLSLKQIGVQQRQLPPPNVVRTAHNAVFLALRARRDGLTALIKWMSTTKPVYQTSGLARVLPNTLGTIGVTPAPPIQQAGEYFSWVAPDSEWMPLFQDLVQMHGGDASALMMTFENVRRLYPKLPPTKILESMHQWWKMGVWPAGTPLVTREEVQAMPIPKLIFVNAAYMLMWLDSNLQPKPAEDRIVKAFNKYLEHGGVLIVFSGYDHKRLHELVGKKIDPRLRARVILAPNSGVRAHGYAPGDEEPSQTYYQDEGLAPDQAEQWRTIVNLVMEDFELGRPLQTESRVLPAVTQRDDGDQIALEMVHRIDLDDDATVAAINARLKKRGIEDEFLVKEEDGRDLRPAVTRRLGALLQEHRVPIHVSPIASGAINMMVATPPLAMASLRGNIPQNCLDVWGGQWPADNEILFMGRWGDAYLDLYPGANFVTFQVFRRPNELHPRMRMYNGPPGPTGGADYVEAMLEKAEMCLTVDGGGNLQVWQAGGFAWISLIAGLFGVLGACLPYPVLMGWHNGTLPLALAMVGIMIELAGLWNFAVLSLYVVPFSERALAWGRLISREDLPALLAGKAVTKTVKGRSVHLAIDPHRLAAAQRSYGALNLTLGDTNGVVATPSDFNVGLLLYQVQGGAWEAFLNWFSGLLLPLVLTHERHKWLGHKSPFQIRSQGFDASPLAGAAIINEIVPYAATGAAAIGLLLRRMAYRLFAIRDSSISGAAGNFGSDGYLDVRAYRDQITSAIGNMDLPSGEDAKPAADRRENGVGALVSGIVVWCVAFAIAMLLPFPVAAKVVVGVAALLGYVVRHGSDDGSSDPPVLLKLASSA